MSWLYLISAIFFEITGTVCLKALKGFQHLNSGAAIVIFYILSFFCLSLAIEKIEIGIAYAIWSGVGTAAIAIIGIFFFEEKVTTLKLISLLLIVFGVVGLKLSHG